MTVTPCATFRSHEFGEPRFQEAGRHPTMGRFQKFTVTCARCATQVIETRWLDMPVSYPGRARGERESVA